MLEPGNCSSTSSKEGRQRRDSSQFVASTQSTDFRLATIEQVWKTRGLAAIVLWPLSLLFRLIAGVRRNLYRAGIFKVWSAPVPVVVVGNLTVGGSGKTPLIITLAEKFCDAGIRPGIVCRGYRAKELSEPVIATSDSSTAFAGDEPVLIAGRTSCPVSVYPIRKLAIKKLLGAHKVDLVLLDDGLQHYALDRDIEIVVVSEHAGFGNGFLLPAGPLREPLSRLRDVDYVVRSRISPGSQGSDLPALELPGFIPDEKVYGYILVIDELRRLDEQEFISANAPPGEIEHRLKASVAANKQSNIDVPLTAMAGIANPGRFFKTLTDLGLQVETVVKQDHHQFAVDDFQAGLESPVYILTEKDAVKCKELKIDKSRVWYAKMTAVADRDLVDALVERLAISPDKQSDGSSHNH